MISARAEKPEATGETKEVLSEAKIDPVKKLKEDAKLVKPLNPFAVIRLTLEEALYLFKETFASDEHLQIAKNYFEKYLVLYGKTEPSFSSIRSLFGRRTNQTANFTALMAIGSLDTVRKDLISKHIFNILCNLKKIQEHTKPGETLEVINSLLMIYRMPLDWNGFDLIKGRFSKALEYLVVFNETGKIPNPVKTAP